MLRATFLGHQGWSISSSEGHVLVDPLLLRRSTDGEIYPPREIVLTDIPPVDAVFISHTHEDHFDIPTLNRLHRDIPLYVSARSSVAISTILREMGFTVHPCVPGGWLTIAPGIEMYPFAPDHMNAECFDEWDVLPFVLKESGGRANFLSFVDVTMTSHLAARVREVVPEVGIMCVANNVQDYSYQEFGEIDPSVRPPDCATFLQGALQHYRALLDVGRRPRAIAFSGGGWSLTGDLAYLNGSTFPVDSNKVATALSTVHPEPTVVVPLPGESLTLLDTSRVEIGRESPFILLDPRDCWPDRAYRGDVTRVGEYAPYTDRCEPSEAEWEDLDRELSTFAETIYGTPLFRWLYSLDETDLRGRKGTFVLALICDTKRSVVAYEYAPSQARFMPADCDDIFSEYLAGMECWMVDLLELLRGNIPLAAVASGRHRVWNHPLRTPRRDLLNPSMQLLTILTTHVHPLRRPDRALRAYRAWLSREPTDVERAVRAGRPT